MARAAAGARQGQQCRITRVRPWCTRGAPLALFNVWFLHFSGTQPQGDETGHCLTHPGSPLVFCQAAVIPFHRYPLASFWIQAPTPLVWLRLLIGDARHWEGLAGLRGTGALALPCESRSIFCSPWTAFQVPRNEGEDLWGGSCPSPCSDPGSCSCVCSTPAVPCAVIPLEKANAISYCRDEPLR